MIFFLDLVLFKGDPRPSRNSDTILLPAPREVTNSTADDDSETVSRVSGGGGGEASPPGSREAGDSYLLMIFISKTPREVARGPALQHGAQSPRINDLQTEANSQLS